MMHICTIAAMLAGAVRHVTKYISAMTVITKPCQAVALAVTGCHAVSLLVASSVKRASV